MAPKLPLLACVAMAATSLAQNGTITSPGSGITAAPTPSNLDANCPAVLSTTAICSTCVTADCVTESTLTVSCGCPAAPFTVFTSLGCDNGCAGLGCQTVYEIVQATTCTDSAVAVPTTTAGTGGGTGSAAGTGAPTGSGGVAGPASTNAARRLSPFRLW